MNTNSYDNAARAVEATPPGEHIPGPPSGGLIVLWVGWLIAAAVILGLGAPIFLGILQGVAGGG